MLSSVLRRFRARAGFSQQELAERASISVQAISALERGSRKAPYRYTLDRLAEALSLTADERSELQRSAKRGSGQETTAAAASAPNNLPRQLTAFFGRDDAVREIVALLGRAPLVSIVGPGGAGKTRLSIAVGSALLSPFPDGVWFVDLAPVIAQDAVPQALAAALRVDESPARSLIETLVAYLAQKRTLVILDNCEHVMPGSRAIAGTLLRECPGVSLLITSREALAVAGERAYRIPSLAVPAGNPTPEEALRYGAVELFVDRMRAANTHAEINRENVASIVEICSRLNGLPLALELAAARTTILSPSQLCAGLDRVFDTLGTNDGTTITRHATMRAVIDWSFDLLAPPSRLLFARLAVFVGSFSLESVADVCCDEGLPAEGVVELLSSLAAQSLIAVDFASGDARYHLLEATRQYAAQTLARLGESQFVAQRHATAFVRIAQRLDRDWYDASERGWFRAAQGDIDNFRAALNWALADRNDVQSGLALAAALARVWYSIAPVEGRRWVRVAIDYAGDGTPSDVLARLCVADAELCGSLGEYAASLAAARRALEFGAALDELLRARAEQAAGSALSALERAAEGQTLLEDAFARSRVLLNRRMQALVLGDLGTAASRRGDIAEARRFYADALERYEALHLERPAASIAGNLAEVEFAAGDAASALQLAEQARAGHEATQNRRSVANDLANIAAYLVALDSFEDARTIGREALAATRDVKRTVLTACVLQHLAAVAVLQARDSNCDSDAVSKSAAMLLGFVDAWLAKLEAPREYTERQEYERVLAALRDRLGERLDQIMAHGSGWAEDAAVAAALEM